MAELVNYNMDLRGIDLKLFLENIERGMTQKQINLVREWAFKISKLKCNQCGHEWVPRIKNPRMCAKCHSIRWDKEPER